MKIIYSLGVCLLFATCAIAQAPPPARVVVTRIFEKELAPTTQIMGVVDFDKKSGISSEVSGLIEAQFMIEGQKIPKGAELVRLNMEFIRKRMDINQKEIEQIDVRIQNTRKNLNRYEILFKEAAASEKNYDDLSNELKTLLVQKEISLQNFAKLDLESIKSTILAPFAGVILIRHKTEGEWISPGDPVCTLASIEDVIVRVAVPEELIQFITIGDTVPLQINALDKKFSGKIKAFAPIADLASKTIQLKIKIPYFEGVIQNMSVTVDVPAAHKKTLKMIKRDARVRQQGKDFVYTVKEGKASILPINIVGSDGEYLGVDNANLKPGMAIVIDGNDRLRPDQPVTVVPSK